MNRVLLTGATGFVGPFLSELLHRSGYRVVAAVRREGKMPPGVSEAVIVGDIGAGTNWKAALVNIDAVIHLAGRAHVFESGAANSDAFMEVNALGTKALATACAAAQVRRFVYLSTVKVNGEETHARPFGPTDDPSPQDAYGVSKLQGEKYLMAAAEQSKMDVVIVRPPLVYGPGVRANFAQMMRWVHRGWPLPLGAVKNARSLVSIWNLTDLLLRVLEHPQAAGRTFMASDGVDLSTPELLRLIGRSLGSPARVFRIPVSTLHLAARVIGAAPQISKLCGSLQVDIAATRQLLEWTPPLSMEESMARTAAAYLAARTAV